MTSLSRNARVAGLLYIEASAVGLFGGLWLLPLGLLVYRSRFLPRWFGVWLGAAGFAWLAFSITGQQAPALEDRAYTITQPVALGEVAFMLWLVVMGARMRPVASAPSLSEVSTHG